MHPCYLGRFRRDRGVDFPIHLTGVYFNFGLIRLLYRVVKGSDLNRKIRE